MRENTDEIKGVASESLAWKIRFKAMEDKLQRLEGENESLKSRLEEIDRLMRHNDKSIWDKAFELEDRLEPLESGIKLTRSDTSQDRIKRLDVLLSSRYPASISFDEIGKLLEMGPNHPQIMTRFSKYLSAFGDGRYIITQGRGRGTPKAVRLSPDYKRHLEKNKVEWSDE